MGGSRWNLPFEVEIVSRIYLFEKFMSRLHRSVASRYDF